MKWNFFYPSIVAFLFVCNTPSFSQDISNSNAGHSIFNTQGNWYVGIGTGVQFPIWHSNMNVDNGSGFHRPNDKDRYSILNNNGAVIAASAGWRWQSNNFWLPSYSLGIFYQYLFKTNINGRITQYSLPEFKNYEYTLDITSTVVLAAAKINLFQYGIFSPYINGGIGSAFNNVSNYRETALSGVIPRITPGYKNANTNEFAYNIGAGVDFQFIPQLIFSIGYIYQDLGPVTSGFGIKTWSSQSLTPGSYQSNELLVNATYLFDTARIYSK